MGRLNKLLECFHLAFSNAINASGVGRWIRKTDPGDGVVTFAPKLHRWDPNAEDPDSTYRRVVGAAP